MITNNVTRLLDSKKVIYQSFELPLEKLGAIETSKILGVETSQVFKTIVVTQEGKGKPVLAVIPGDSQVDLKRVAKFLSVKKVNLPSEREAEKLTGLQAGGISPLALLNRGFIVILDKTSQVFSQIHISGGVRGLNILLSVDDLISLTNAHLAEICNRTD